MPRPPSDDEYDSDSGSEFDDVTDVQLGLPDGLLEADDESNPLVSRIGGRAAWLPMKSTPPKDIAKCKHCKKNMQLLVQIFAPLEESAYDRCLIVWGCARAQCQRTDSSSLRVIRTLKHNPRWAAKLEKQRLKREAREARQREKETQLAKRKQQEAQRAQINPFATFANSKASTGLGDMLFGGNNTVNPFASSCPDPKKDETVHSEGSDKEEEEDSEEDSNSEEDRLAEELEIKAALSETIGVEADWVKQVSKYPPLYLNTIPETITKKSTSQNDDSFNEKGMIESSSCTSEGYEKMMLEGIDDTFEKFVNRVGKQGNQVVRYQYGGEPIPFHARGQLYNKLWPKNKSGGGDLIPITKVGYSTTPHQSRRYDASVIPPCPICGSNRTFECQLMPNLINLLRPSTIVLGESQSINDPDDQDTDTTSTTHVDSQTKRKHEIEQALGRTLLLASNSSSDSGITKSSSTDHLAKRTGLVWNTAFIYVCQNDCCIPTSPSTLEGECWREEWIGVQFEDEK